jgi:hypothetical protein
MGFVLNDCCERQAFASQREIGNLVLRARIKLEVKL